MAFGPLMRPQAIPQQCGISDARRPETNISCLSSSRTGVEMGRTRLIAIIILAVSSKAGSVYAQLGAPQPPASPELLFNMTMQNETRLPLGQDSITTPNMDIHLYGDGKNIIVAVGK